MVEFCRKREEKTISIKRKLPPDEMIVEAADFFDAFSDATRLKILLALMEEELCTRDLSNLTGLSVSAISHQLRLLKDRRIVSYRRERRNVFYRLDDEHIRNVLKIALEHLGEKGVP